MSEDYCDGKQMIDIIQRMDSYAEKHCWQYDMRIKNYEKDLLAGGIDENYIKNLRVSDFRFENITEKKERKNMTDFIKRHEWLGTLSQYTTHWFACYHKDILSGVILFNIPNSFSKIMGEDTHKIERLISRGACISWSPKNLASSFLMWCIKWMVDNTDYRLFTAYSDPTAKELGTIYQACNFYYMGQKSGTNKRYVNPYTNRLVSDRFFRVRSSYKKYAKELGIEWQKNWNNSRSVLWVNIPDEIEKELRKMSKAKQKDSKFYEFPNKHKYAFVLGRDKKETKKLRKLFLENNKVFDYPKDRN